jgi:short-subunit dehydrogenase
MNVVITGASKGIGKAIAEIFVQQGHTILICSRNEKELEEVYNELQLLRENSNIYYNEADLSKKEACINFAKWCSLMVPQIDILVNNTGQFLPGSIHNEADGMLEQMIQTNLYSAYYITRALTENMIANKSGQIFNICSIASLQPYANGGSYSISKYALLGFSKNLREELKPYGIKVCAVLPGAVYTNSWSGSGVDPQRIMEANDIAKMIYATSQLSPQAVVEDIVMRPQLGDL